MAQGRLDKQKVLATLEVAVDDPPDGAEDIVVEQMSLARSVLKLAGVNREEEYKLCRSVAERLLGRVPEPEDMDV